MYDIEIKNTDNTKSFTIYNKDSDNDINNEINTDFNNNKKEFGGNYFIIFIIIFSHIIIIYLYSAVEYFNGSLFIPTVDIINKSIIDCYPTYESFKLYSIFMIFQTIIGIIIPGIEQFGLPLEHLKGKRLIYNCNAYECWWTTLIILGFYNVYCYE